MGQAGQAGSHGHRHPPFPFWPQDPPAPWRLPEIACASVIPRSPLEETQPPPLTDWLLVTQEPLLSCPSASGGSVAGSPTRPASGGIISLVHAEDTHWVFAG